MVTEKIMLGIKTEKEMKAREYMHTMVVDVLVFVFVLLARLYAWACVCDREMLTMRGRKNRRE